MALPQEFVDLAREVNNWGRWGDDDELGTLNLITPDVVRRGAACVRSGRTFALGLTLSERGPQTGALPKRVNPLRTMTDVNTPIGSDPDAFCMSDDVVFMSLQCATHWDALTHASYAGRIYNGFGAETITAAGARKCGIHNVRSLVGRGVLVDVARAKGVERLEGGYAVTSSDLDDACAQQNLTVEIGDIVLIRTGHIQLFDAGDRNGYVAPAPGPGMDAARWFHAHDVAAVATDTMTFEVFPPEREDLFLPVHRLNLVEVGLLQGQNFHLETLAADCAEDGEYTFFLEATPEPFFRAVGAPVQPIAIK